MTTEESASAEVVRLHRFFHNWYAGEQGLTIAEFADAMDLGFTIVSPQGRVLGRDAIIAAVHDSFGSGGVSITVENVDVTNLGNVVVARYDEVHTTPRDRTRRISSAVLVTDPDTPGGYRWITVHETWAPS